MGEAVNDKLLLFSEIISLHMTLKQIHQKAKYDEENNLIIEASIVSLVYFRAGYAEKDFQDEV
jgi:hypothetical protein